MSKETFTYLCEQLSNRLSWQDTVMRTAISVKQRVAVTLWFLATPAEYRTIAHLFGIARSTVCEIVHETCKAIVDCLLKQYIQFPSGTKLDEIVHGFLTKWGVPQCVGAIDGSHIPIAGTAMNHTDYYNRKGWYSVILQGVVDHSYRFLDINVGWPGSVHDARVFARSSLYSNITEKHVLPDKKITINGIDIPLFLIGDSAYPLDTWLMKPFTHSTSLTQQQQYYNYRLCRARIVVENAYGRLKARWRRLMKRIDMHIEIIPTVISAACILHNMCEIHGETFQECWLHDIQSSNNAFTQPNSTLTIGNRTGTRAKEVREGLVSYFNDNQ